MPETETAEQISKKPEVRKELERTAKKKPPSAGHFSGRRSDLDRCDCPLFGFSARSRLH